MKVDTLWISTDIDIVGYALPVADLSMSTDFPIFETRFAESKLAELERFGKEHKALALKQDQFMLHLLCRVYVAELRRARYVYHEDLEAIASRMSHAFDGLIAYRNIQHIVITADPTAEEADSVLAISATYKYTASMRSRTIHLSNVAT